MSTNNREIKPSTKLSVSAGLIGQLSFNEPSVAQKMVEVGGSYDILGAGNQLLRVGTFAALRLANTDTAAHYCAFGDNTLTAPTGITNGIWLAPNSVTYLSSGTNMYAYCDSATVQVCRLQDNLASITRSPTPPQPQPNDDTETDDDDNLDVNNQNDD